MSYNEQQVKKAQELFSQAIDLMKQNYTKPANEIPTSMVIADLAAKTIKWDCIAAQDVAYELLEEVNEHRLAKEFKEIANFFNEEF